MSAVVIFDSKHGSTADAAALIASRLGEEVSLIYLRDKGAAKASLEGYSLAVLGGPVYAGRWSRRAAAFAREREAELSALDFAYFSVGADVAEGPASAAAALPAGLAKRAVAGAKFGGEFRWNSLNPLERFIISLVSRSQGANGAAAALDAAAIEAFAERIAPFAEKKSPGAEGD